MARFSFSKFAPSFAVRLPPDSETRCRTKSFYAKKAIADFLEAEKDYLLAVTRLEEHHPASDWTP